jgi:ferredoxin--NADP+ reductase/benzoate/toluate 1,2-dioxygenase reductase subunit
MGKKTQSKRLVETSSNINIDLEDVQTDTIYKVHEIRNLTDSTYVLRFDRNKMDFTPGQHITLGLPGDSQLREYSIYSPNTVDYLEVIIREVEEGLVSKKLRKLKKGDIVNVEGPFGFFTLDSNVKQSGKFLFIATGTGIAPFHSIAKSFKNLNYTILHGIRTFEETYESNEYEKQRYISCTSRDNKGDFNGRVTDYLSKNHVDSDTIIYLCGNYEMIHAVYDILTTKGISPDNIRTEVYF